MRKSLLKTVVATAIVGAVMTVSSVVAWAETTVTYNVSGTNNSTINKGSDIIANVLNASGASATIKENSNKITTINVTGTTQIGNVITADDTNATSTKFARYALSGNNKKEFTIKGTAGQTVGIYYAISDSAGYAEDGSL